MHYAKNTVALRSSEHKRHTVRYSTTLSLAILAAITAPLATAASVDNGWYVGINAGQSRAKIDDARITSGLLSSGFVVTDINNDDRDTGFKLFGGYQLNKYFAVESGYFNLGEFGYTATTVPAGTYRGTMKIQGLNLDAVGILPITPKFSALGRVGLAFAEAKDSLSGSGAVPAGNSNPSKRAMNYKFGVGLQYALTDAFALRAEAERYHINDAVGSKGDADLISVGLIYRFGGKSRPAAATVKSAGDAKDTTAPTVTLATPYDGSNDVPPNRKLRVAFSEPMDPQTINAKTMTLYMGKTPITGVVSNPTDRTASFAPTSNLTPDSAYTGRMTIGAKDLAGNALTNDYTWTFRTAPLVDPKIETKAIVINKVVALEDTHFQFDKATLTKEGKNLLDHNIQIMKDNPNLKVRIAGYTSAAGTQEYNQKLSERRASTVMTYIADGGIAAKRLDAVGYGETRPAVHEATPSDTRSSAAEANMRVLFEIIVK